MCLLPRVPGQGPGSFCNPKHKLAAVVSCLVDHQIPAVVVFFLVWLVLFCLLVCLGVCSQQNEVADEPKLPPGLDNVYVYNYIISRLRRMLCLVCHNAAVLWVKAPGNLVCMLGIVASQIWVYLLA